MTGAFSALIRSGAKMTLSDVDSKLVEICLVTNRIVVNLNANFLQYFRSSLV